MYRTGSCVDFFEFDTGVHHEATEPCFRSENVQVIGEACAGILHRLFQVAQHPLLGDAVQFERTSRWEQWKVRLDGAPDLMAGAPAGLDSAHRSGTPNLAHEVEDSEDPLSLGSPQPSSELLEKHRGAFGRPQHEYGVDFGKVDTVVEEIDREDGSKFSAPQSRERRSTIVPGGAGIKRHCRVAET